MRVIAPAAFPQTAGEFAAIQRKATQGASLPHLDYQAVEQSLTRETVAAIAEARFKDFRKHIG
jgi:hypothetical protein